MVKHTQTNRQQIPEKLSMFDHFVELALKGLVEVHCGNNDHFNTEHGMVKSKR